MKDVVTELLSISVCPRRTAAPTNAAARAAPWCMQVVARLPANKTERVAAALRSTRRPSGGSTTMLSQDTNIQLCWRFPTHHRLARMAGDTINAPGVIHFCRAPNSRPFSAVDRDGAGAYGSSPLTKS